VGVVWCEYGEFGAHGQSGCLTPVSPSTTLLKHYSSVDCPSALEPKAIAQPTSLVRDILVQLPALIEKEEVSGVLGVLLCPQFGILGMLFRLPLGSLGVLPRLLLGFLVVHLSLER
jgi:hypothetical protein